MSKKRDPVVAVLNYFLDAELPAAMHALALAQAIVKRRQPRPVAAAKPRAATKVTPAAAAS